MRMLTSLVLVLLSTALMAMPVTEMAPKYVERVGPYEVRFSAIPTADLPPEVTRRYELTRSERELLINIHLRRVDETPLGEARRAEISATVRSLIGQQQTLELREISEGEAIYYLATYRVGDLSDRWIFDLEVKPEDAGQAFTVRFERQFD